MGEQALYWTDIPGRTLWRWNFFLGQANSWPLPKMADCIAMTPDGWVMAVGTGIFLASPSSPGIEFGPLQRLATAAHTCPDVRLNDGRCDRQGRFQAGTMMLDASSGLPLSKLYRLDATVVHTRHVDAVTDDLIVPNGLAFSPDGKAMYLPDSHTSRQMVRAFDYDIDTDTPYSRRIFIDMNAHLECPDGAVVNVDGCYWVCGNDVGFVRRFTPDGRLNRSIVTLTSKPAMCAFGGSGLDTLFVTPTRIGDDPLSGATLVVHPGMTGLPKPVLHL